MWQFGEAAVSLGERALSLRHERGGAIPPMWPVSVHSPVVTFRRTVTNAAPAEIEVEADGDAYLICRGRYPVPFNGRIRHVLPVGENAVMVRVMNFRRVPAIRVSGGGLDGVMGWEVHPGADGRWEPCETGPMGAGDAPPGAFALPTLAKEKAAPVATPKGPLFDFGREMAGFVTLDGINGEGRVRVVYGESREEALGDEDDIDAYDFADVRSGESLRLPVSRAFRYVNVRCPDGVSVGEVLAEEELLPLERRGMFRCDDERLNRIWEVSVRTLHLTAREFFLDGIKRDRWPWSGDARQSFLMNYYAFADADIVRRTILVLRGKDPVLVHMNGILDYTLLWFAAVDEYVLYTGDTAFAAALYPGMKTLMAYLEGRNVDGAGRVVGRDDDWVFIDWAPEDLHNKGGATAFMQILYAQALDALASAARAAGDGGAADGYARRALEVRGRILPAYWNEERGALMHLLRDDGLLDGQLTRYPNIFAVLGGLLDDARRERVVNGVLLDDSVMKLRTPYMRFYELEALCRTGRHRLVLDEMRSYWGGMLDLGATSFWEVYDPAEKGAAHYKMYNRKFGRSLCHSWGASPVYLLGRYFLGVEPVKPGFAEYVVRPNPGGLRRMEGVVPTPLGDVSVKVDGERLEVRGCNGVGKVFWRGRTCALPPGGLVEL